MHRLQLFTDGSMYPPTQVGFGAVLAIGDGEVDEDLLCEQVQLKRFEATSSSPLEVETLLWALGQHVPQPVTIYTDSQALMSLPGRRQRLERRGYVNQHGAPMRHARLYQRFFQTIDAFECSFVKVKGHRAGREKEEKDRLFTLVDRASRRALRAYVQKS